MKVFNVIVFFFLLSCHNKEKALIPREIKLHVMIAQSFADPMELTISKTGEAGYATIKIYDHVDTDTSYVVLSDSVRLTNTDFEVFFKTLDTVSLLSLPSDTANRGTYTDGGTFAVDVVQDGKTHHFEADQPSRKKTPSHYNLLDAVFHLANRKFERYEAYIEDNQSYYEYSPYTKVKASYPKIIRMYGPYPVVDSFSLTHFFKQFPDTSALIVDLSNIGHPGLDNIFKAFDRSHPHTVWVSGDHYRYFLPSIGVDSIKIAGTLSEAMRRTAANRGF